MPYFSGGRRSRRGWSMAHDPLLSHRIPFLSDILSIFYPTCYPPHYPILSIYNPIIIPLFPILTPRLLLELLRTYLSRRLHPAVAVETCDLPVGSQRLHRFAEAKRRDWKGGRGLQDLWGAESWENDGKIHEDPPTRWRFIAGKFSIAMFRY